jgi:hypothetical protein
MSPGLSFGPSHLCHDLVQDRHERMGARQQVSQTMAVLTRESHDVPGLERRISRGVDKVVHRELRQVDDLEGLGHDRDESSRDDRLHERDMVEGDGYPDHDPFRVLATTLEDDLQTFQRLDLWQTAYMGSHP